MKPLALICTVALLLLVACSEPPQKSGIGIQGRWINDAEGNVMTDPQTSGLKLWRGKLLTVSDASGDEALQKHLIALSTNDASLLPEHMQISLSDEVKESCFGQYLDAEPDYEGLAIDPDNDKIFYLVTEDATRGGKLTAECKGRYRDTGSTDYPTLLVKLALQDDNSVLATHVRPLQFSAEMNLGDYPNDGFEALAFGQSRTLYLGLEKDADSQPRIFSLTLNDAFWQTQDFALVHNPKLKLPRFESGSHPINGMDYYQTSDGKGYLLAAARNDEQLWVIDTLGKQETKVIQLHFLAETKVMDDSCQSWEVMDNASIEGVAVKGNTLWMINDPWRKNYHKNIQCPANKAAYKKMAPLLFNMPIESAWFE